MKIALLSPIAWRTPPRNYGPWELVVSLLAEGLIKKGLKVTLFATGDSITQAGLASICPLPYEENPEMDPKVWEALHIAHLFEQADQFDIIHNNYDFLPLVFTRLVKTPMVTTIHGFSSPKIVPVYREYNQHNYYVSISNADRSEELHYTKTIYHGIDLKQFDLVDQVGEYLLYFGRIHQDKGTAESIEIALKSGIKLIIAGIIQDRDYYNKQVAPYIDGKNIVYYGVANPAQRNQLMGGALALIHPIHFHEPFGLSVVEAMACGTPIIAFNKGSMPEVIDEGKSGFLVNSVEEACQVLPLLPGLSRQYCRHWVENNFSWERMIEEYIQLYQEIVKRGQF
ncbi:MAG: glycosyltransferase family 4 protein [Syntrophomonadaceae bacterium]|jgi:glycosyltransferase involved in cell wall biosynthesis|nr:glycosyltransferase family 4 protein [Syntrophomonadaceae bacterium]